VLRVLETQGSTFDSKTDGETRNNQSNLVQPSLLQLQPFKFLTSQTLELLHLSNWEDYVPVWLVLKLTYIISSLPL